MKVKTSTCAVFVGWILASIAVGQSSVQLFGTVTCRNATQIELKCDDQTWVVKITPGSTTINPPSAIPGTTALVGCKAPDAQRKESPTWTPAPCSTPKPTPPTTRTNG